MKAVITLLLCALFLVGSPVAAAIKSDLGDKFVTTQFDWAMYLRVQPVSHYLDYRGSKLHPLCRVRVYYRAMCDRNGETSNIQPASVYEDFWYADGKVIGVRRYARVSIDYSRIGALFVSKIDETPGATASAANAIVRLMSSLHLENAQVTSVVVPEVNFDAITASLGHYNFQPQMAVHAGPQFSIHVQSATGDKDGFYFYQK